ncbi:MAG: hypothetical protein H6808_07765 [Phycisphaera sp.]|nr:hypothetical protein [Phycisphaera sp.]
MGLIGTVVAVVLMAVAAAIIFVFILIPVLKLLGKLFGHIGRTLVDIVADALRFVGSVLVIPVFMLLTVGSVVVGRWSATGHYGRAVSSEFKSAGLNLYRVAIGHPLRLIGLGLVIDGFEKRLPEVVAAAPGRDKPKGRKNQFDGYTIVGSLAGGGSGARLYIAEPDDLKLAAFERRGIADAQQVVIKAFHLNEGSSLPQIIRESRALDAAKRLGLVLEHDLTEERFYYVMRYVPGDQLTLVAQRAHADSGAHGLNDKQLRKLLGHGRDLFSTLSLYHSGGLWHKDVKPDNVVVDETGAHLVDLGLITPLRSAMTLTTHGTEYFRDPELVRMALRGVKVNEVDGAKFDIYAAAAVLYSMIENSFPAHGGLSQITRRCPESVRWIIRRGMTEYDKRYGSMKEMLADLDFVLASNDPFAVKPAELPSMKGGHVESAEPVLDENEAFLASVAAARAAHPGPAALHSPVPPKPEPHTHLGSRPRLQVTGWWSGKYRVDEQGAGKMDQMAEVAQAVMPPPPPARSVSQHARARNASEQLKSARARAKERRTRAMQRASAHRSRLRGRSRSGLNHGAAVAVGVCVGLVSIPVTLALLPASGSSTTANSGNKASVNIGNDAVSLTVGDKNISAEKTPVSYAELYDDRGRAVVLSMFSPPVEAGMKARIEDSLEALRQIGFEIVEDLDVQAELRKQRELAPSDPKQAAKSMWKWIDEQDGAYDLALVLAPAPKNKPEDPDKLVALMAGEDNYTWSIDPSLSDIVTGVMKSIGN